MVNLSLDTGMTTPCCKIALSPIDPINGIFNKVTLEVRQAVLDNVRSPHCEQCWNITDKGGLSRREQHSIHNLINWNDVDLMQPPEHIQIKFSKECQLQCVYCGPWSSTTWQKNIDSYDTFRKPIDMQTISSIDVNNLLDVSKLKSIQVSGGEPMLSNECIEFLKKLEFLPSRDLLMITNLSYGRSTLNKLLSITKIHPNICINVSLDAWGNNDSRKYLNWNLWKENFDILLEDLRERRQIYKKASIRIKCTINLLTYQHTPEIIDQIISYRKKDNNGLTFRFGTPFMNEMSSLWSGPVDKTVKIALSDNDWSSLTTHEQNDIKLFNKMIQNSFIDPILEEKTKKYFRIYFNE